MGLSAAYVERGLLSAGTATRNLTIEEIANVFDKEKAGGLVAASNAPGGKQALYDGAGHEKHDTDAQPEQHEYQPAASRADVA
ncbi:hypothetical protein SCUCBS95973_007013 [Sporothrix curviconia]|uniref:Uncharacterized protein n=1 Tax=Sporothrix curviconia TaxID=1260050 RepID=A0ABP0CAA2_9PEZI